MADPEMLKQAREREFNAWYKANYKPIAATSSWIERARAAYDAGIASQSGRIAELEAERDQSREHYLKLCNALWSRELGKWIPISGEAVLTEAAKLEEACRLSAIRLKALGEESENHAETLKELRAAEASLRVCREALEGAQSKGSK